MPLLPVYTPPSTSSVSPDYTQCDPQCNGPTYLVEELGTERFVQVRHHETTTSLAATPTTPRGRVGRELSTIVGYHEAVRQLQGGGREGDEEGEGVVAVRRGETW